MCLQPITKKSTTASNETGAIFNKVPCGKCPKCLKNKLRDWMFRIEKELERSHTPLFVTLTYDENHVPWSIKYKNRTLEKKDLQDWFKRLRHHYKKAGIKYYAVGEYGKNGTERPHYHIILLNMDRPELIEETWGKGRIEVSAINNNRILYTLKYVSKPREKLKRTPEFSLVSKGIGKNYLTERIIEYHKADIEKHSFLTKKGGQTLPIPKYYKELIYNDEERRRLTVNQQNMNDLNREKQVKKFGKNRKREDGKVKDMLKYLELSELHNKFDTRKNEVL